MSALTYDEERLAGITLRWGEGFMSPGGEDELATLLSGADLNGLSGLDFGCGLGGYTELLATRHGARQVIGIDIDRDLIERARRRAAMSPSTLTLCFVGIAPGPLPFADARFDFVLSKEVLVRIAEKRPVLAELYRVLRPGGRLFLSDWYCAEGPLAPEMRDWAVGEGYAMTTLDQTAAELKRLGFQCVEAADRTDWFRALTEAECRRLERDVALPVRLSERKMRSLHRSARLRWRLAKHGQLRPGHVRARKPG